MTWVSPETHRHNEAIREARTALTLCLSHVFLACAGPGEKPCAWCQVVVAFDHATTDERWPSADDVGDGDDWVRKELSGAYEELAVRAARIKDRIKAVQQSSSRDTES